MIKILFDISFTNIEIKLERVIIFERDSEIYYINDWCDKISDVNKMPSYIKDDYYKYESKILTISIFNKLIMKITKSPSDKVRNISSDEIDTITQIKRELKLKELL